MKVDEFNKFIRSMLALASDGKPLIIEIMPGKKIAVKRSMLTDENKVIFIKAMARIKNIHKGISYIAMSGGDGFEISTHVAFLCQGIGKAFKVWDLVPMDLEKAMIAPYIKSDTAGMLPMNTGLNPR